FFSSRRRHTRSDRDWSSDVCSSDLNGVPATDPEFWGLTLRVADPAARAAVKPFEYEPVPQGQTIVSLIGIKDDEMRSAGFALRQIGRASCREGVEVWWGAGGVA